MTEHELDISDLICPESLLLIKKAVKKARPNDKIKVINNQDDVIERRINEYGHLLGYIKEQSEMKYFNKIGEHTYLLEVA
ncbi:hypothetical protein A1QO_00675 [Vibrio genomosp. F10 str. ZF-129]|uniref:UPF0033 domain-containing protein n=1 Tax=Vibrio genomosp. F10 str. ZF-129 TaxID=1187848 RepID=A0A1E5BGA9_9VIBR|nr:sulfurtransferase TusA family protein [Vibrio genomosp. F10]OEE35306.1 hypothetical protein A1QO_00675 [Vibrio genomosp. F10 str. ZF-129]